MAADFVWAVTSGWQRRHLLAAEAPVVPGALPGSVGRAVCGRSVMDQARATYIWASNTQFVPPPQITALLPCEICTRLTGIVVVGPRGERMSPGLAAYARRADRAEREILKDDALLREVMIAFGEGHDLTGRDPEHAKCPDCRLLRRIRFRLASADRVANPA